MMPVASEQRVSYLLATEEAELEEAVSDGRREKDSRNRITKADIGLPQDFRHVSHVEWDPNRGFVVDNVEDPQLKRFFEKAGVSDSQLQDRETREFIYDFINRHGGLDAVKNELVIPSTPQTQHTVVPLPVPARTTPTTGGNYQIRSTPHFPPPSRSGPLSPPPLPSQPSTMVSHRPPPPPLSPLSSVPAHTAPFKDSKRTITKADIGLPQDFRHVSHVGWDPNKGFNVDNIEDPQSKQFFEEAGVSDSQLQDRETCEFSYDFINRHGDLDAVRNQLVIPSTPQTQHTAAPPPVLACTTPSGGNYKIRSAPPPPKSGPLSPPPLPSQPPAMVSHPPPPPPLSSSSTVTSTKLHIPPLPVPAPRLRAPPPPPPSFSVPDPPEASSEAGCILQPITRL